MLRNLLAGVLIAALPIILLLSDRDWVLSDQHRAVAFVSEIPANASGMLISHLDSVIDWQGVHVLREPTKAETLYWLLVAAGRAPPVVPVSREERPRYGYSIQEFSFLGMPFGWRSEFGFVLYKQNRWELIEAPLNEAGAAMLQREAGRDLGQGFIFPFWAHAWGWLYVAAVALWGWLRHRWVQERRAAEGII